MIKNNLKSPLFFLQQLFLHQHTDFETADQDHVRAEFAGARFGENPAQELFIVRTEKAHLDEGILLVEPLDHAVGVGEIGGEVQSHLALLLGSGDQLLIAGVHGQRVG